MGQYFWGYLKFLSCSEKAEAVRVWMARKYPRRRMELLVSANWSMASSGSLRIVAFVIASEPVILSCFLVLMIDLISSLLAGRIWRQTSSTRRKPRVSRLLVVIAAIYYRKLCDCIWTNWHADQFNAKNDNDYFSRNLKIFYLFF